MLGTWTSSEENEVDACRQKINAPGRCNTNAHVGWRRRQRAATNTESMVMGWTLTVLDWIGTNWTGLDWRYIYIYIYITLRGCSLGLSRKWVVTVFAVLVSAPLVMIGGTKLEAVAANVLLPCSK